MEKKRVLLDATLVRGERVRSYRVRLTSVGWQACSSENQSLVHERHYTDWHQVEHALRQLENEISELRAQGWSDG